MKKVLLVAPYFYPKIGGMEKYALNVAQGLKETHGWEVVVVTSNHEETGYKVDTVHGIKVYRLPYWFKLSNTPINPLWFFQIGNIIKKEKPDIINGHSPVPFIADVALYESQDIPYVMTYHAGSMLKHSYPIDFLIEFYESVILNACFKKAKAIISYSQEFIKTYLAPYKNKVVEIPPGIDTKEFVPATKNSPSKRPPKILFVGRIEKTSEWKGIDYLLKAVQIVKKTYPEIELELIGPGDAIEKYQAMAAELGIGDHTSFPGGMTGEPLIKEYHNADMLVLPSTTNAESFGIVLLEAMACGLPVIGSKIGGIVRLIENNVNGLLVEPKNETALAKAILKVLGDKAIAKKMGAAGRKKAEQDYEWAHQIEKYNTLFEDILRQRNVYQVTAYYPPNLGGMQKVVQIIAEFLARKSMPTTVLTSDVSYTGPSHVQPEKNLSVIYNGSFEFAHTPLSLQYIFELIKTKKPALFHLHVANAFYVDLAFLTARLKGIPYVAHIHIDPDPSGKFGFLLPLYKNLILKPLLNNADAIIFLTESQKWHFIKKYNLKNRHMKVIPNGVSKEFYITRRTHSQKVTKLLFVGRLSIQKNIPLMLEALKMVQCPVELHIVGEGDDRTIILQKIKELQLNNVTLHGALYKTKLIDMYSQSDIFLFPTNNEGMSLALLEAMAAGLPVITSALEQNKELLGQGALFVKTQNAKRYAEAIDSVIRNPAQLKQMSETNLKKAQTFSWDKVIEHIMETYTNL